MNAYSVNCSAYYGAKVEVKVLRCDRLSGPTTTYQSIYDREVDLYVAGKVDFIIHSHLYIYHWQYKRLIHF